MSEAATNDPADVVQFETGVTLTSVGQLEAACKATTKTEMFAWLRLLTKKRPLLLTNDNGLPCKLKTKEDAK